MAFVGRMQRLDASTRDHQTINQARAASAQADMPGAVAARRSERYGNLGWPLARSSRTSGSSSATTEHGAVARHSRHRRGNIIEHKIGDAAWCGIAWQMIFSCVMDIDASAAARR